MTTSHRVLASSLLVSALVLGTAGAAVSGTSSDDDDEAPIPSCQRSPASADQGEDIEVRGSKWEPESTVTIGFDESPLDDEVTDDTTDTSEDSLPEDDDGDVTDDDDLAVTAEVDEDGRFEVDFTIPETAVRGTHSLNVSGLDGDGLPAHCAKTVRLNDHPEVTTDDTTDNTTDDTTDDTDPDNGETPPSTESTTSTSSP